MGNGYKKGNDNNYFRARKEAAKYDKTLYSRAGAAESLGVSVSTLADYELGITKVVPVDKVVLMADMYNCPEFKNSYCKNECPIGKTMPIATEVKSIEGVALRLIRELESDKIRKLANTFAEIAVDGVVTKENKTALREVLYEIDELALVLSEAKLVGEKAMKG